VGYKKAAHYRAAVNHIVGSLSLVFPIFLAASARFSDSFLGNGGVRLGPVVGLTEFEAGELSLSFLLVSMSTSPF